MVLGATAPAGAEPARCRQRRAGSGWGAGSARRGPAAGSPQRRADTTRARRGRRRRGWKGLWCGAPHRRSGGAAPGAGGGLAAARRGPAAGAPQRRVGTTRARRGRRWRGEDGPGAGRHRSGGRGTGAATAPRRRHRAGTFRSLCDFGPARGLPKPVKPIIIIILVF
jgi:hypothetical protein